MFTTTEDPRQNVKVYKRPVTVLLQGFRLGKIKGSLKKEEVLRTGLKLP